MKKNYLKIEKLKYYEREMERLNRAVGRYVKDCSKENIDFRYDPYYLEIKKELYWIINEFKKLVTTVRKSGTD